MSLHADKAKLGVEEFVISSLEKIKTSNGKSLEQRVDVLAAVITDLLEQYRNDNAGFLDN